MAGSRNNEWESSREVYTPDQVEAVLREIGIDVREETENDFLSFCPFHGNSDSPAFSTSKTYGYSICFNPSCAVGFEGGALTLEKLAMRLKGLSHIEAKRIVLLKRNSAISFEERFDAAKPDLNEELKEFPKAAIDKMHERFMNTPAAKEYMRGRGFEKETMEHFNVGFALKSNGPVYRKSDMVVVPAYDHRSRPVGLVGRSIVGKDFKNFGAEPKGTGFHKSQIIWNLQNARRYETIILTESTFDSMRIHQAGYPNVGALLGGSLSATQEELLKRHFTKVIIMTDNETGDDIIYHRRCNKCLKMKYDMCQGHAPGRDLGMKIAERLPNMRVFWGAYDHRDVYANGVKDAAAMTDDEIRQTLRNAVSHYEYLDWLVA